jgi:homoserine dehydrogenase
MPKFIPTQHPLANVDHEFNGVIVDGEFSGTQIFVGKGAGSLPTGAAALSDLAALSYGYSYRKQKLHDAEKSAYSEQFNLRVYVSSQTSSNLDLVPLSNIMEEFSSDGFSYRVGTIGLSSLKQIEWAIRNKQIFVAEVLE